VCRSLIEIPSSAGVGGSLLPVFSFREKRRPDSSPYEQTFVGGLAARVDRGTRMAVLLATGPILEALGLEFGVRCVQELDC
jgi:hypothetical protein